MNYCLGIVHNESGNVEKAVECFELAANADDPELKAAAFFSLSEIFKGNDADKAKEYFDKAREANDIVLREASQGVGESYSSGLLSEVTQKLKNAKPNRDYFSASKAAAREVYGLVGNER
ncbi:MAG: hypothetical protein GY804_07455 [Alphaproteobacteria bacterium]|nr:hypothetical protein [Alphaproteobacteria bacterium]